MNIIVENYTDYKEKEIFGRYINNDSIANLNSKYSSEICGYSVNNLPIHFFKIGSGKTRLLIWSQMHGNESTSTKALFDSISFFCNYEQKIYDDLTILVIPILNPDGALKYTRNNYNNVDLNRDAVDLTQPESLVLKKVYNDFNPDFCFNLHDQRSIYSTVNFNSSILSFLSPSSDFERNETDSRVKSMKIILDIYDNLRKLIPNNIGRYNDEFNINCVGDTFQSLNTPTILFESGHYSQDYTREISRYYTSMAITYAVKSIYSKRFNLQNHKDYYNIPENSTNLCDVFIKNIKIKQSSSCQHINLSILYKEKLNLGSKEVEFLPEISEFGKLEKVSGHLESDFISIDNVFDISDNSDLNEIIIIAKKLRNIH